MYAGRILKDQKLEPFAPVLLESMRAVGYSPESAIADLLDNSLSAGARNINILFPPGRPDYLAILDDGQGMTLPVLIEAMRHGSSNPNLVRTESDLGRFGLGLKTASLSQGRRVDVISFRDGALAGCSWNLDHIAETRDWTIQILEQSDFASEPLIHHLLGQKSGTLVIVRSLDRLAAGDSGDGAVMSERLTSVREHLMLVFHRFISGELGHAAVSISINNGRLPAIDPFLTAYSQTQKGPTEQIEVAGHAITLQPFTLPHISLLNQAEIEMAGGAEGLRRHQGFYVYRHRRLIIWGTWFRMFRQEELTKLTRVRVDIPNALDHLWALDIKKSAASPPESVKVRLRSLIPRMCREGRLVQQYRGRLQTERNVKSLWNRIEERGSVAYRLAEDHPVLSSLRDQMDDEMARCFRLVLKAIEESFPGEAFYNDRAADRIGTRRDDTHNSAEVTAYLEDLATQIATSISTVPLARRAFIDSLPTIEPFSAHPDIARQIRDKLKHEF